MLTQDRREGVAQMMMPAGQVRFLATDKVVA
jgi:hypothetical protein